MPIKVTRNNIERGRGVANANRALISFQRAALTRESDFLGGVSQQFCKMLVVLALFHGFCSPKKQPPKKERAPKAANSESNEGRYNPNFTGSHHPGLVKTSSYYRLLKLQLVLCKMQHSIHKHLWKLHFLIKKQRLFGIMWNHFDICNANEINVSTLHVNQLPRKGVIVYAGASDWFRRKIDSLCKGRKTLYRAKYWKLPLELCVAGLKNMVASQKSC